MHAGEYPLAQGGTCRFVVGTKGCLSQKGYINSSAITTGGWDGCARRTWCNEILRNAIPETLRNIFLPMNVTTGNGYAAGNAPVVSVDYFALPAEKEVFGKNVVASSTAEAVLFQFEWFKTESNREPSSRDAWTRSPAQFYMDPVDCFAFIVSASATNSYYANALKEFRVFGCI